MPQTGKAPFSSAWGYRNQLASGRLELLRREVGSPPRIHTVWTTWWLADVTMASHTRSLSDSYAGGVDGGTGARNIFIGGGVTG